MKLALFEDNRLFLAKDAPFSPATEIQETVESGCQAVRHFLDEAHVSLNDVHAIAARGGLLRPMPGGTYRVNEMMLQDLSEARYGRHASNFSSLIADALGRETKTPAYVVDPVTVDELTDVAAMTGIPAIRRRSIFHALSQKAAARQAATELGLKYEQASLVVAHLGGGISVGAHRGGRVIDVNNALDGDGPMSPERAGTIPAGSLADLCFSGKHDLQTVRRMLTGCGGGFAHCGTRDMREVEQRIQAGDTDAERLARAMSYGIAKQIGAMATALDGRVDAIVLTGALVGWSYLRDTIRTRIAFLGPVLIYTKNLEMPALALGVLRVLTGEERAQDY